MTAATDDDFTVTETAHRLGRSRPAIRALLDAGRLERVWDRQSCEWRVSLASIECFELDQDLDEMAP